MSPFDQLPRNQPRNADRDLAHPSNQSQRERDVALNAEHMADYEVSAFAAIAAIHQPAVATARTTSCTPWWTIRIVKSAAPAKPSR
jgi:hypothetical protein